MIGGLQYTQVTILGANKNIYVQPKDMSTITIYITRLGSTGAQLLALLPHSKNGLGGKPS